MGLDDEQAGPLPDQLPPTPCLHLRDGIKFHGELMHLYLSEQVKDSSSCEQFPNSR